MSKEFILCDNENCKYNDLQGSIHECSLEHLVLDARGICSDYEPRTNSAPQQGVEADAKLHPFTGPVSEGTEFATCPTCQSTCIRTP